MKVGQALLDLARGNGRRSLYVVGTGKNVGKTVTVRAICEAARERSLTFGLTSIGRDGEAYDIAEALRKPRLFLAPGAVLATARDVLPPSPAVELAGLSPHFTAAGPLVFARVRTPGFYEIVGPPTASGVRAVVRELDALGCDQTVVDGAIDRVAAVAGGGDSIVVCAGASGGGTMDEAVDEIRALVKRLSVPQFDSSLPLHRVDGALTASTAAHLAASKRDMQIVVRDPTQIAMSGKALLGVLERLDVRCERPLNVVAATVASIGPSRYFEPRTFLNAVARATALPVFDVYAASTNAA